MKIKKYWPAIVMVILSVTGCAQNNTCEYIQGNAKNPEITDMLKTWVDERSSNGGLDLTESIDVGSLPGPGSYIVPINFDAKKIGLTGKAEARVISIDEKPVAVFFGDESMKGILIKLSSSKTYGMPKSDYTLVSERVAVVCKVRD